MEGKDKTKKTFGTIQTDDSANNSEENKTRKMTKMS